MTQDMIFVLLHFILFVFQSEEATAMTLRELGDPPKKCDRCDVPKRNFTKEKKYFQKLIQNFYKYKYSLAKGWGAAGMPFNVLYTPNAYQQKILKSIPRKELSRRYSQPRKPPPEIYNLVLEDEKPQIKESAAQTQYRPRKYYSLIPQLFVSYGW